MKIFIGADRNSADFPELTRLQKIAQEEGFTSYRNWVILTERLEKKPLQQAEIIIRGGYAGICVSRAAIFF